MWLYSTISCILLLSIFNRVSSLSDYRVRYYHEPYEPFTENYIIAPDVFGDRETLVVVHYDQLSRLTLQIKVILFDNGNRARPQECSFNVNFERYYGNIGVSSVRRLDENRVVLAWYSPSDSHFVPKTRILIMDLQSCQREKLLTVKANTIIVPSNDSIDVIVDDNIYSCNTFLCRINYPLKALVANKTIPFDVDLDFQNMQVERLESGNLVVHGSERGIKYKFIIMDYSSGKIKKVIKLRGNKDKNFVALGLSYCSNEGMIYCVQYDEDGKKILDKLFNPDGLVILTDIHTTRKGELMLIAKRSDCKDEEDCWNMWVFRVSQHMHDIKHTSLRFPCTGDDKKKLVVPDTEYDKENEKVELYYACKNGLGYTFSSFSVY